MPRLLLVCWLALSLVLSGCATAPQASREDAAPWTNQAAAAPKAAEEKEEFAATREPGFWEAHPIFRRTCIGLGISAGVLLIATIGGALLLIALLRGIH